MDIEALDKNSKKILEKTTLGVWFIDPNANTLYVNEAMAKMLGYERSEIVGRPMYNFMDDIHRSYAEEKFEARKKGIKEVYGFEFIRKDKAKVYALMHTFPIFNEKQQFEGGVAFVSNISKLKRIEYLLEMTEITATRMTRAYELLSKCNLELLKMDNVTDLYRKICNIIVETGGYKLAWIGLKKDDQYKSIIPVAQAGYEEGYLKTLNITWADEERGKGPAGTSIRTGNVVICLNILTNPLFKPWREDALKRGYVSEIAIPLILTENKIIGSLNIYSAEEEAFFDEEVDLLKELTNALVIGIELKKTGVELKKSKEKYERAYNKVEFFKDLFTHDITNILQGLYSGIQLIQIFLKDSKDLAEVKEIIQIIDDEIQRGSRLVENIHKLSIIDKMDITLVEIDAYVILKNCADSIRRKFRDKKMELEIKTELKSDEIKAKTNKFLEDIFDNLLINAIKHNNSEKIEIIIYISKEKRDCINFIKFQFIDNGYGIKDELKEKLFLRADDKNRLLYGRGLGLSLVKKIIDSYNGFIWVENRIKDDFSKGSNFILIIPEAN